MQQFNQTPGKTVCIRSNLQSIVSESLSSGCSGLFCILNVLVAKLDVIGSWFCFKLGAFHGPIIVLSCS